MLGKEKIRRSDYSLQGESFPADNPLVGDDDDGGDLDVVTSIQQLVLQDLIQVGPAIALDIELNGDMALVVAGCDRDDRRTVFVTGDTSRC